MPSLRSYVHRGGDEPLLGVTVDEMFRTIAERFPENEAVVCLQQDERLTYTELDGRVDRAARALLAMGVAQGARQEAESVVKNRFERLMSDYDFVMREEFDIVLEMAARARQENESLKARMSELEDEFEDIKKELTALQTDTATRN